jgi:hypothetical protein
MAEPPKFRLWEDLLDEKDKQPKQTPAAPEKKVKKEGTYQYS